MQEIPSIDIAAARQGQHSHAVTAQIDAACRDIGFMYITGHGISHATISAIREAVINYFDQPLEQKTADQITPDNYRGYIPAGFFSPNTGAGSADNYEGYKLHFETEADDPIRSACDLYGPNKWPATLPALQTAVLDYWNACDEVTTTLLEILAQIIGTDPQEFLQYFDMPLSNMTLLHYPPQDVEAAGFGIHPHKDTDALTLLMPDAVGGLQVRQRNSDDWLDVESRDDALVVNIGDLLELWSGGYFVSTPHKVVNTSGAERYSFPYFAVPRFDTVVAPLRAGQPGFARDSVHVGDVSREVWRTNWPDAAPQYPQFDLGTL